MEIALNEKLKGIKKMDWEEYNQVQEWAVDNVEDRAFLRELIEAMYEELPTPKKRKK